MPTSDQPGSIPGDDLAGTAGFPPESAGAAKRQESPPAPPSEHGQWSVETLALLHAGALEGAERDWALAQAASDPAAQAVLSGLDRVCEQLRRLDQTDVRWEPMPEFVARRLDRELARLGEEETGRRRRWGAAASVGSVAAAAAVLSLVTYIVWPGAGKEEPQAVRQAESSPAPAGTGVPAEAIADRRFNLNKEDFRSLLKSGSSFKDLGPLADNAVRSDCLVANGFSSNQPVVAAGRIKREDKEGIFMMIQTISPRGTAPEMTVLVVGAECGAGIPATISKQVLGRN